MHDPLPTPARVASITVAFAVGLAAYDPAAGFTKEGGAAETATIVLLALAAMRLLLAGAGWPAMLATLLTFRELDWDKAFLSDGILKSNFYRGNAPLDEKLIGGAVVLFALIVIFANLRLGWRPVLNGLRRGTGWVWLLIVGVAMVVVAKSIDGLGRKLEPLGIELSPAVATGVVHAEEVLELAFAFCICVAAHAVERRRGALV
ncbi:hypothetical protein [Jannaschia sp. LMIT008]|uniref:hypothetical protein n=1 Tax=Jannaschia maritima TaxID=3032585 RepID=UPI002810F0BA|nr:hypothetical protein [Jannaschia sp. LMIT008]